MVSGYAVEDVHERGMPGHSKHRGSCPSGVLADPVPRERRPVHFPRYRGSGAGRALLGLGPRRSV